MPVPALLDKPHALATLLHLHSLHLVMKFPCAANPTAEMKSKWQKEAKAKYASTCTCIWNQHEEHCLNMLFSKFQQNCRMSSSQGLNSLAYSTRWQAHVDHTFSVVSSIAVSDLPHFAHPHMREPRCLLYASVCVCLHSGDQEGRMRRYGLTKEQREQAEQELEEVAASLRPQEPLPLVSLMGRGLPTSQLPPEASFVDSRHNFAFSKPNGWILPETVVKL